MRHIVYCWEMGGGLGHVMPLAKIAAEMVAQGYRVTCVVSDLAHMPRMLTPIGVAWLPIPRVRPAVRLPRLINHADILHNSGYDTADNLFSMIGAWRTMFSLLKPDRVVCEYAPTARLAAWSLGLEVACIDTGFSMPPLPDVWTDPLPAFRDAPGPDRNELVTAEQRTLEIINSVLQRVSAEPLSAFSCLFREKVWYRNWYEFNHFWPHSPEKHLGQVFGDSAGAEPIWPSGTGPKVFAYLKPGHAGSVSVLKAAVSLGFRVLAYLPGFPKTAIDDLVSGGGISVSSLPIRLGNMPDDVEIGIWHSPTGAVARCLDKGMRMIFLPMHAEQHLACMAVQRSGLPAHVSLKRENWHEVFDLVGSWPRVTLGDRWRPADVPLFASKLALG